MAGKKRQQNKSRKSMYGRGPDNEAKNAKRRQATHLKKQSALQEKKKEVRDLITQCCTKFHCGIASLKKNFGTLNERRVDDLLSDRYQVQDWYKKRLETRLTAKKKTKKVVKHDQNNLPKADAMLLPTVSEGNGGIPTSSAGGNE